VYFKTRDGTLKDPEIIALKSAIEYFNTVSWDERGSKIHCIKDLMVEGWAMDKVQFLTNEEWDLVMKEVEDGRKKAASYVV
jgi:hypothetical protein